jgi:glutamate-1-semialdehyde 2,1-aminomutase
MATGHGLRISSRSHLLDEYGRRTLGSSDLYRRLVNVLPGGETRAVTYFAPYPVAIERGRGSTITDLDGNRYRDVLNNYTSLVHGHAYPPILEAVAAAVADGSAHPAPSRRQLDLAELLCERYSAVRSVRFTNSGTEAAILALRIARRATGRRRMVMFADGYHGTAPEFADPDPESVKVPYNDLEGLAAVVDDSTAAVFAEPFLGSGGVIPPDDGFLAAAQHIAQSKGAIFVLDEVQSLRNAFRGAHGELGLNPDLVLMGKIIGGGFAVGAVGGRAELLGLTAGDRPDGIRHSGTFNGNPVVMAAGVASLTALTRPAISQLLNRAELLQSDLEAASLAAGVPATIRRAGSILQVHLIAEPTAAAQTAAPTNQVAPFFFSDDLAMLHLALLVHGIYAAPRGMLNLSTVMSDLDMQAVVEGYGQAFMDLARIRAHEGTAQV